MDDIGAYKRLRAHVELWVELVLKVSGLRSGLGFIRFQLLKVVGVGGRFGLSSEGKSACAQQEQRRCAMQGTMKKLRAPFESQRVGFRV